MSKHNDRDKSLENKHHQSARRSELSSELCPFAARMIFACHAPKNRDSFEIKRAGNFSDGTSSGASCLLSRHRRCIVSLRGYTVAALGGKDRRWISEERVERVVPTCWSDSLRETAKPPHRSRLKLRGFFYYVPCSHHEQVHSALFSFLSLNGTGRFTQDSSCCARCPTVISYEAWRAPCDGCFNPGFELIPDSGCTFRGAWSTLKTLFLHVSRRSYSAYAFREWSPVTLSVSLSAFAFLLLASSSAVQPNIAEFSCDMCSRWISSQQHANQFSSGCQSGGEGSVTTITTTKST